MKTAVVIGAGIAGLAAAARLQAKGYQVDVFEHQPYAGGKLTQIMVGDYRFDAGPSIFTMPHYVDEVFRECGKNPKDYFEYEYVDEICNYFWEDGTRLSSYADVDKFAKEVEEKLGVDPDPVRKMIAQNQFKFDTVGDIFLRRSLHRTNSFTNMETIRAIWRTPRLGLFKSMNDVNKRLNHPKLVQLFNRFATYNGSNPYQAPSILNLVGHLELGLGIALPKGGMHDISQSVYKLAQDLGVRFHFGNKVEEIIVENQKKAKGIKVAGEEILADVVICNMDVYYAYHNLMPNQPQPKKVMAQPRSSSGIVFYWGIKKAFPELILHNAFMTNDSEKEFDCIFNKKKITDDPTIYINITSKHVTEDAPQGGENWFTMINVPHIEGQDWDALIAEARKSVLAKIKRILGEDISPYIEAEEVFEPRIIQSRTLSYKGSLYGSSSNTRMGAFFRHPNFSRKIKNLYFCGGSVHPGGGIPVCLSSAKIVADMIPSAT